MASNNEVVSVASLRTTSANGDGFCNLTQQTVVPATPSSGYSLYADSAANMAWKTSAGNVLKFDASAVSASRSWTLPDSSDALVGRATTDTLTNKTIGSATNTVDATHIKGDPIVGVPGDGNFVAYNDTLSRWEPVGLSATAPATYSSGVIGVDIGSSSGTAAAGNDARFSSPQIRIVKASGTGSGEFTSIAAAIASITDAAANKPYTVEVHPGVYESAPFTVPAYVVISGYGAGYSTVISPSSILGAEDPFVVIATNGGINGCLLAGNGAGIAISADSAGTLFINNIVFTGFTTIIKCTAPTADCTLTVFDCAIQPPFVNGIVCTQTNGGFSASVTASGIIVVGDASSSHAFKASGPLASIVASNSTIRGLSTGNGFHASNGAIIDTSSVQVDSCYYGLYTENVGSAPTIRALSAGIFDSVSSGIYIDHPGTTGVYIGTVDRNSVYVNPASPFTLSYVDPAGGTVSVGDFAYSPFPGGVITDHGALLEYTSPLGTYQGGAISAGTGLAVNISAGEGYVLTGSFPSQQLLRVVWDAGTLGALSANTTYYVRVVASATVSSTTAYPDRIGNIGTLSAVVSFPDQYSSLVLGRVRTTASGVEFIDTQKYDAYHVQEATRSFLREAFGAVYVSGSIITPSSLQLSISSGVYFYMTNRYAPTGLSAGANWYAYYHSGGSWTRTTQSAVSSTEYDNGTSLTSLSAGNYTMHTMYTVGVGATENYFLVYGQTQDPDLNMIRAAAIPTPPSYFTEGVVLIGAVIVQEGNPSIVEVLDLRPVIGGTGATMSGITDHGQLTGLLDDDHPQYLPINGTRAMTGALDMGSFAITNVGLVDGVDVSAHASRHLPNGADPLTTAAPTAALTTATANSEGIANSFSRSDHTHAIDQSTFSLNSIGGTLSVAKGGTGATTLTAGNFLVGNGTSSVSTTKAAPTGAVLGTTDVQTLTNKTIIGTTNAVDASALQTTTTAVVVSGSAAPVAGQALIATSATTAAWAAPGAALVDSATAIVDATDSTRRIMFDAGGSTGTSTTLLAAQTANRTLTFPDATDTLVARTTADTLSNKKLVAETSVVVNGADITKELQFSVSGASSGTKTTLEFTQTANRVITLPDSTDTIIGRNTTDTLTNKTITGTTNNIAANSLKTTSGAVVVSSAAPPTAGQVLTATSATSAEWDDPGANLVDNTTFISDVLDSTKKLAFDVDGTTGTKTTLLTTQTVDRVISLPDATDTLVAKNTIDLLANKSLIANTCEFADGADSTKRFAVDVSGATSTTKMTLISTQTANRALTLPDTTDTLVARGTADTLTNKTLILPVISQISNTGTLTLPTSADTLVGRATTDTLTNKTLIGSTNIVDADALKTTGASVSVSSAAPPTAGQALVATSATTAAWIDVGAALIDNTTFIVDNTDSTKRIAFDAGGTASTTTTLRAEQTANRTITFPDTTDTLLAAAHPANLTNKNLFTGSVLFVDTTDNTKQLSFNNSAQTTGTSNVISAPSGGGYTWTMPSATATLVGRATTDTLSNKTLLSSTTLIADTGDNTKTILFVNSAATTGTRTTMSFSQTVNRTLTFPDATDTMVARNTTDTLGNKSLQATNSRFVDTADATKTVSFSVSGATTGTGTTLSFAQTANRTLSFPNATDTIVARNTTDTLTNKSFSDSTTLIVNATDSTKRIAFSLGGMTSASTNTFSASGGGFTWTLPGATTTIVGTNTTNTLTNKTITDTTNNVAANSLKTTTGVVTVSGATAPSAGQALVATDATTAAWSTVSPVINAWIFRDVKTSGTNGGSLTSSTWNTRTINTTNGSTNTSVILSTNFMLFSPGTYFIRASSPAYEIGTHRIRIYDPAGAGTSIFGPAEFAAASVIIPPRATVSGYITPSVSTTIYIQHYAQNTVANGGGIPAGIAGVEEVYTVVEVIKLV